MPSMDRAGSRFIEAVSGGWPMILSSLKSSLEAGESLEPLAEGDVEGSGGRRQKAIVRPTFC
jgi:hypothetical protein